tara:strand:+ start:582 stop:995 length:414 start_codon:yes stop_codon:yes gene_type:complete
VKYTQEVHDYLQILGKTWRKEKFWTRESDFEKVPVLERRKSLVQFYEDEIQIRKEEIEHLECGIELTFADPKLPKSDSLLATCDLNFKKGFLQKGYVTCPNWIHRKQDFHGVYNPKTKHSVTRDELETLPDLEGGVQ